MKRLTLALAVLALAGFVWAENGFDHLSVTATSQTLTFAAPRNSVMICNYGTNEVYYRLFDQLDTPAAATTSYAPLLAGTASAPVCVTWTRNNQNIPIRALSIVCDTAETATVDVLSW